jgi:hypothetical protein
MRRATNRRQVRVALGNAFEMRYRRMGHPKMTGFLFADPRIPIVHGELVPIYDVLDQRSGDHIDFFVPGYSPELLDPYDWCQTGIAGRQDLWFSHAAMQRFLDDLDKEIKPHLGGEMDLMLLDAHYRRSKSPGPGVVTLDFGAAITCDLAKMVRERVIGSPASFFSDIITHADSYNGPSPTAALSDEKGVSALRKWLLSLPLLNGLGRAGVNAAHFAVRDVRRRE